MPDQIEELTCDLLVVGAGMAGLTAAAAAARAGLEVWIVERSGSAGGSAVLSGGYVWRLDGIDEYARVDPGGDRSLQAVIVQEFDALIEQVAELEVAHTQRLPVLQGHGHQVDLPKYFRRAIRAVESAGGQLIVQATVAALLRDEGRVTGAMISDSSGEVVVHAGAVLIATGGFAQSPDLIEDLVSRQGRTMRARAGEFSCGDGLRLAQHAGAAVIRSEGFYGHLIGAGVDLSQPEVWDQLTLLHSRAGWLYNRAGERFTDESRGDNINAEALVGQPDMRALLVWDDRTHQENVLVAWPPGNTAVDRFESALRLGASGLLFDDPDELRGFAADHGFSAPTLPENKHAGPYRVLIVEPAITFPFAGTAADAAARVLDEAGRVIPGLFTAGVDTGGVYREGYGGGLALAGATGIRAARSVIAGCTDPGGW